MDYSKYMLSIDPKAQTQLENYKLMTGIIVPRPIALVSTVSRAGARNLAPFSFFTGVGSNPPTLCFCPALQKNEAASPKDTLRNIEETGEFVVNIVNEAIGDPMNLTAADVAPDVDEFELSGLTPIPSEVVKPSRVAESPVQIECRLMQVIRTGNLPASGVLVLGEIVRYHVREDLFDNFRIDHTKLNAIGRLAGNTYVRTQDRFDLIRPK
jgi:flavin reductase (DIM6/NTAB) family NADH-FMN oxidoreductase RutF